MGIAMAKSSFFDSKLRAARKAVRARTKEARKLLRRSRARWLSRFSRRSPP